MRSHSPVSAGRQQGVAHRKWRSHALMLESLSFLSGDQLQGVAVSVGLFS